MPETTDTRRKYGGRLDRSIPWETQRGLDEIVTWRHLSSRNAAMSYLIKMEMPKIRQEQMKAAASEGALILPSSKEEWRVWLKEEAGKRGLPEAELLGKCMTSYLEGLKKKRCPIDNPLLRDLRRECGP